MRKTLVLVFVVALLLLAFAPVALAHNTGHVITGNGSCVDVGSGNAPPEGLAVGTGGHPRGIHHAIHAGNGTSAVVVGSC